MAIVNRTTLQIKISADPNEHDLSVWLLTSDIPDAPKRYWISPIVGDTIELEDAAGQAAADVAYIAELKKEKKAELEDIVLALVDEHYPIHRREFIQLKWHEARATGLTNKLAYLTQMINWIEAGTANLFAAQDIVDAATTETEINAITIDLSSWAAADPLVSIRTASSITD